MGYHEFMTTALLLIAHGSRNAEANDDLYHVVGALRRRGLYEVVEGAFLEIAQPDIATAAFKCVGHGAHRVVLLPYFLSPGIHVREDLQEIQRQLGERFPAVEFLLGEPLGRHESLIELLELRARETMTRKH